MALIRRDLLADVIAAFALTIGMIGLTAGLGVLALIDLTCTSVLVVWALARRWVRGRDVRRRPRRTRRADARPYVRHAGRDS